MAFQEETLKLVFFFYLLRMEVRSTHGRSGSLKMLNTTQFSVCILYSGTFSQFWFCHVGGDQ